MVTSSNTIAGYGAVGAGIPPYEIKEIITVVKAYSSAVGAGEFAVSYTHLISAPPIPRNRMGIILFCFTYFVLIISFKLFLESFI